MSAIGEIIAGVAGKIFNVFKVGAGIIVARILGAFGLSLVSLNAILPSLKDYLTSYANLIPPKGLEFLGAVGMDVFMSCVLSALTIRLATKIFILPTSVANQLPGGGQ
ncbi:DUF2523 family protein [Lysobacter sp. FW306-1B-D06B]|uniref:DUF2523 family protein n=1 Tax=Lysobacter sp. FW306-1B-D06B TaxID=3140250 RepID=UPI003140AFF2